MTFYGACGSNKHTHITHLYHNRTVPCCTQRARIQCIITLLKKRNECDMHNIKHFVFNVECDSKVKTCIINIFILFTREPQMQTLKKYQLDDVCVCVCLYHIWTRIFIMHVEILWGLRRWRFRWMRWSDCMMVTHRNRRLRVCLQNTLICCVFFRLFDFFKQFWYFENRASRVPDAGERIAKLLFIYFFRLFVCCVLFSFRVVSFWFV